VSSLLSFGSLALFAVSGSVPAALAAWLYGFLGSQLLLTPLVLAETALTRDRKLLWLLPGLYWYWTLQLVALLRATFGVIVRPSFSHNREVPANRFAFPIAPIEFPLRSFIATRTFVAPATIPRPWACVFAA